MKTSQYLYSISVSLGLLLSGCANYQATTLTSPSTLETLKNSSSSEVLIVAKAFDRADCKKYLDRNVIDKGYQPIQLYIQNNSDKNYLFSLNRISLSCARPEEVAEKVHTSTVGRAVGYGVGAILLWPLAIPAIVDGVKSSEANRALDNDFASKAAKDELLPAFSHLNKILFVPVKEYQSSFTISLEDPGSHQIETWNVSVN